VEQNFAKKHISKKLTLVFALLEKFKDIFLFYKSTIYSPKFFFFLNLNLLKNIFFQFLLEFDLSIDMFFNNQNSFIKYRS
jgi:hypothetical protein